MTLEKSTDKSDANADLIIDTKSPVHAPISRDRQIQATKHIPNPLVPLKRNAIVAMSGLTIDIPPAIVSEFPKIEIISQIIPVELLFF